MSNEIATSSMIANKTGLGYSGNVCPTKTQILNISSLIVINNASSYGANECVKIDDITKKGTLPDPQKQVNKIRWWCHNTSNINEWEFGFTASVKVTSDITIVVSIHYPSSNNSGTESVERFIIQKGYTTAELTKLAGDTAPVPVSLGSVSPSEDSSYYYEVTW